MFIKNDYVVYQKKVFQIMDIQERKRDGILCYKLIPLEEKDLSIEVPVDNPAIRSPITKEKAIQVIHLIPSISPLPLEDDKYLEAKYKSLLQEASYEDYITIIKTAYLRNHSRMEMKKKVNEKDLYYFELAEKYFYNELALPFHYSFEEMKNYIIQTVQGLVSE